MSDPRKECPPDWQDVPPDERRSAQTASDDDWS